MAALQPLDAELTKRVLSFVKPAKSLRLLSCAWNRLICRERGISYSSKRPLSPEAPLSQSSKRRVVAPHRPETEFERGVLFALEGLADRGARLQAVVGLWNANPRRAQQLTWPGERELSDSGSLASSSDAAWDESELSEGASFGSWLAEDSD